MKNVLTLIAPQGALNDSIIASATEALSRLGADTTPPDWLSEGEACDISFSGPDLEIANEAMQDALDGAGVDFCVQGSENRRKKILIADMDSTIVTSETLDDLAAHVGRGPEIAAITQRSMLGEIDFAEAVHERIAMLKGLEVSTFQETLDEVTLSPGAETLVRTMTAGGAYTALVSGGFDNFTGPVAAMAGFDEHRANRFEIEGGRLTGQVIEPVLRPEDKLNALIELSSEHGVPISQTLAIGDGANDVPMIRAAGLGIAYRGKPITKQATDAHLDHTDLTSALFAQGYRRSEFVT
ncbi:MAG: phosphoserine phosphatase SerB [Alphaproteobacteria bacterium]|nr:phosphoserine phosphatase SerB [Alphaproteobacteria bacterium]MBT7942747.1 phosphoserine phosphatase SerB [Alphaproteobacteria bacterium]